ncbi:hypothetical protein [Gloeothece verrucosa]|uniref:Uncharacterized protein n=1 Tax=Gloeothece verrucosa (strain PCC 7822) TaxID=497965 RepID=E0UML7_GLOV7|nr:hypothetical protein [Gloeothece verrucosa]ADN18197.1 hypothetical protein Cyan7822_6413 [Gloeothece verrucosa PCC 7822]
MGVSTKKQMKQERAPPSIPLFSLQFTHKAQKQLKSLSPQVRQQYQKAFHLLSTQGTHYRSLRTHRYQQKKSTIWGSSASMFLRFYWKYQDSSVILIIFLGSH